MKNFLKLSALVTVIFLVACGTNIQRPPEDSVLATYGEHTILAGDFVYWLRSNIEQEESIYRNWLNFTEEEIAEHWAEEGPDGQTNMERIRQNTLEEVLNRSSMLVLAREDGHSYDPGEREELRQMLEADVEGLRDQGFNPEEMFYEFYGITLSYFENIQTDMLIGFNYINFIGSQIDVPAAQVNTRMIEQRSELETRFGLTANAVHILVSTTDLPPEEVDEARAFAEELLERVNEGENPRILAATYSDDPGSPDGFYNFHRGMMVPPFEEWAFDANFGDTGIIETTFGFHVMVSEGQEDLSDYRAQIIEIIQEEEALEFLMTKLEERNIQWEVDYELLALLF